MKETDGKTQYEKATLQARAFIDGQMGASVWDSYRAAGYKGKKPTAASRLADMYRPAIEWRKDQLAERCEDERDAQLERLKRYARGSLADIYPDSLELGEDEWKRLPREIKDLISEIVVENVTEGKEDDMRYVRRVKIRLEPRMAAEKMLAQLGGWFAAKKEDPEIKALLERLAIHAAARKAKGS